MGRDRTWKAACLAALTLLGLLGAVLPKGPAAQTAGAGASASETVVIDPGHGGEDGGAVAGDGTVESAVNLEVALRLDALLNLCGVRTELLRREDISLHDPSASTLRAKKVSDLHNRVSRVNAVENARLISIHQNHFSSPQYSGAQVFYTAGPLGQPWAEATQTALRDLLDPDNTRRCKPVPPGVYLMNHVTCPAILVECGFLSHPAEAERLRDPDYQSKLALAVGGAYLLDRAARRAG